jgi:hypothetical protein
MPDLQYQALTVRLPIETWGRLRLEAFEQHTHVNKLIIAALEHAHDCDPKSAA